MTEAADWVVLAGLAACESAASTSLATGEEAGGYACSAAVGTVASAMVEAATEGSERAVAGWRARLRCRGWRW